MVFLSEVVYYMEDRVWVDTKPVCDDSIFSQVPPGTAPKVPAPTTNTQPAIMKPTEEPPAYSQPQQTQVPPPPAPPHTPHNLFCPFTPCNSTPLKKREESSTAAPFRNGMYFHINTMHAPPGVSVTAPG